MNKNNLKTIQNYILTQLKPQSSQIIQFWGAKHKILKKGFLIKKINLTALPNRQTVSKINTMTRQQWFYRNSMNQFNILKRHNLQHNPKCHKIIKTSNSIYLVYDQYKTDNLLHFLTKSASTRLQKLQILVSITTQINYFHLRDIFFLNLSANNIHVCSNNQVLFSDWSIARDIHQDKLVGFEYLSQMRWNIADQVIQKGQYTAASDIFSLGKIFQQVMQVQLIQNPSNDDLKLQELITRMTKRNAILRPNLKYIQGIIQSLKTNEWSAGLRKTLVKSKSLNANNLLLIKDVHSPSKNSTRTNSQQNEKKKQIPVLTQKYSVKHKSTISSLANSKKQSSNEGIQDKVKQICKKRNLAFFLLSLSQFVAKMQRCIDLAFMLVKQARITLQCLIHQLLKEASIDKRMEKLLFILQLEESNVVTNQILLKNIIKPSGQIFKKQLKQQGLVNQRLLKSKIIDFGKQMVIVCEHQSNAKIDQKKITYNLFYTLLVLKDISQGSYMKFWDDNYQFQQINISNQRIMKDELKLGHRYLKSKIAQILTSNDLL